jgi:leader peptidase (prepilin peptidase) / N-methyltransferase
LGGLVFSWTTGSLVQSLAGALIGYASFVAVEVAFKKLKSYDGLGRGDAKLFAVGGALCGWTMLPHIVLIGSLLALIFVSVRAIITNSSIAGRIRIPFGPFVSIGILAIYLANSIQVI